MGLDLEIGPFVGIGQLVGISLFGGTGPVVSLTNIFSEPPFLHVPKHIQNIKFQPFTLMKVLVT